MHALKLAQPLPLLAEEGLYESLPAGAQRVLDVLGHRASLRSSNTGPDECMASSRESSTRWRDAPAEIGSGVPGPHREYVAPGTHCVRPAAAGRDRSHPQR